jgi:hypothetical protein
MTTRYRWLLLSFVLCPLSLLPGCGGGPSVSPTQKTGARRADNPLEAAVLALEGSPDRPSCATAVQQFNALLAAHPEKRPAALTAEQKALLTDRFNLNPDEVSEVESTTYTLLDGSHLEFCFLLRDVLRSLDLEGLSSAEQAATAFAWAMRQIVPQADDTILPPEFVLRFGRGNAQERAHVFLALLHQLGIPGCFIMSPGDTPPWACGALVDVAGSKESQILLFDPRLGLPLPGAKGPADSPLARAFRLALPVAGPEDGRQIVTLAALRREPDLLKPLTADDRHPYDVGREQVTDALIRLAPPLSALSPRMRLLQAELLPPRLGVRVAADPEELIRRFGAAAGVEGGPDAVRGRVGAAGVLRNFLGEDEGGVDKQGRRFRALSPLIPHNVVPPKLAQLNSGDLVERVRLHAIVQFVGFQMEPRQPRDLVLRGKLDEAATRLTELLDQLVIQKDMLRTNPQLQGEFNAWVDELVKAFGDVGRAQEAARKGAPQDAVEEAVAHREQVWKKGLKLLSVMVEGGTAEERGSLAMYQLALCMHEQAERLQTRADRAAAAKAEDVKPAQEAARRAWKDAAGWWNTYLQKYPLKGPSVHARLLQARVRDAQGNRDQARALLEDIPGAASPSQQAAWLYLARRPKTP